MSRTILFAAFLLAATAVQAITPARQGANGSGGTCPEALAATAAEEPAEATTPASAGAAAPTRAAPAAAKPGAVARPRHGARWHSFLPGMFK